MSKSSLTLEQVLSRSLKMPRKRLPTVFEKPMASSGSTSTTTTGAPSSSFSPVYPTQPIPGFSSTGSPSMGVVPSAAQFNFSGLSGERKKLSVFRSTAGYSSHQSVRNAQDFSSLLITCKRVGDWQTALTAFKTVLREGDIDVTDFHFSVLVSTCVAAGEVKALQEFILEEINQADAGTTESSSIAAADSAKTKEEGEGKGEQNKNIMKNEDGEKPSSSSGLEKGKPSPRIVSKIFAQNIVAQAIDAFAKVDEWEVALDLFFRVPSSMKNIASYNSCIAACERGFQWETALKVYRSMRGRRNKVEKIDGEENDKTTAKKEEKGGEEATPNIDEDLPAPDAVTYAALVSCLEQCNRPKEAKELMDEMPLAEKEAIMASYAALIQVWSARRNSGKRF